MFSLIITELLNVIRTYTGSRLARLQSVDVLVLFFRLDPILPSTFNYSAIYNYVYDHNIIYNNDHDYDHDSSNSYNGAEYW